MGSGLARNKHSVIVKKKRSDAPTQCRSSDSMEFWVFATTITDNRTPIVPLFHFEEM